jgi:uncharacterized protein (DUF2252 family)
MMKPSGQLIAGRNAKRQRTLHERRNAKMASSAHAYVRGSTAKFYEWLERHDKRAVPQGPPVWICGDCHLGNLGPLADAEGKIQVQIRDLDQTVIGNPNHDLIRLALSLSSAARGSDLPGVTTAHMLEQMIKGYESALRSPGHALKEDEKPECVRVVMRRAMRRTWKHLARERLRDVKPKIPLGDRFWPLTRAESRAVDGLSVANGRRAKDEDYCLMDIKEAGAAAAPRAPRAAMPKDHGKRVVEGAKHLSPALGERMMSARLMDRSVFIRELMPQDLKLEVDQLSREEAVSAARFFASVVGFAHARQLDASTRKEFLASLRGHRSKRLDAPSWLWSSVVDLAAIHEAAYLEHCRTVALR